MTSRPRNRNHRLSWTKFSLGIAFRGHLASLGYSGEIRDKHVTRSSGGGNGRRGPSVRGHESTQGLLPALPSGLGRIATCREEMISDGDSAHVQGLWRVGQRFSPFAVRAAGEFVPYIFSQKSASEVTDILNGTG